MRGASPTFVGKCALNTPHCILFTQPGLSAKRILCDGFPRSFVCILLWIFPPVLRELKNICRGEYRIGIKFLIEIGFLLFLEGK